MKRKVKPCAPPDALTRAGNDAAASAMGNKVKSKNDKKSALDFGMKIKDIFGIIIILGNEMGAIGEGDTMLICSVLWNQGSHP